MLMEFSVGNYRSFHETVTLSLMATPLRDDPDLDERNIFQAGKLSMLRTSAIYGANASGKSNLVRAMMFMRHFILDSATKLQSGDKIEVEPFRLDTFAKQNPSYFQIIFFFKGKRYRYGFELDEERVHSEWLYHAAQRETRLFVRERQEFDVSTPFRREAPVSLQKKTRPNALFLSVLSQFNSQIAAILLDWFKLQFKGISGLSDSAYAGYTMRRFEEDENFRQRVRAIIRLADVGIVDLRVKNVPFDHPEVPEKLREILKDIAQKEGKPENELSFSEMETIHPVFDGSSSVGEEIFDMDDESQGTQKFFALLGPVFDVLEDGKVLVIDELEARLHPLLTREIVRLFNTPASNPHNAQLIFATHDVGLLGECLLRRDQIWFTQKNRYGATELYSLSEMKERKDASYLKNYLAGRYGGIPYLGGLRPYVEQELTDGS